MALKFERSASREYAEFTSGYDLYRYALQHRYGVDEILRHFCQNYSNPEYAAFLALMEIHRCYKSFERLMHVVSGDILLCKYLIRQDIITNFNFHNASRKNQK